MTLKDHSAAHQKTNLNLKIQILNRYTILQTTRFYQFVSKTFLII